MIYVMRMYIIKARIHGTTLVPYQALSSDCGPSKNLTLEFKVLKHFAKSKNIIPKKDNGDSFVILDKCSCTSATEEILDNNTKFLKLDILAGKEINHIIKP